MNKKSEPKTVELVRSDYQPTKAEQDRCSMLKPTCSKLDTAAAHLFPRWIVTPPVALVTLEFRTLMPPSGSVSHPEHYDFVVQLMSLHRKHPGRCYQPRDNHYCPCHVYSLESSWLSSIIKHAGSSPAIFRRSKISLAVFSSFTCSLTNHCISTSVA